MSLVKYILPTFPSHCLSLFVPTTARVPSTHCLHVFTEHLHKCGEAAASSRGAGTHRGVQPRGDLQCGTDVGHTHCQVCHTGAKATQIAEHGSLVLHT